MMLLKIAVLVLLAGTCLAQLNAQGRQAAGSSQVTINCRDQSAVAQAVRSNLNFRCGEQAERAVFKKCPAGQIFNSELGVCVNNPNVLPNRG